LRQFRHRFALDAFKAWKEAAVLERGAASFHKLRLSPYFAVHLVRRSDDLPLPDREVNKAQELRAALEGRNQVLLGPSKSKSRC